MSDLPITPTKIRYSTSSIPSPKIGSRSPEQYKRRDASTNSLSTSGTMSDRLDENANTRRSTVKPTMGKDCPSHLTSFYKENIRELNQLQDALFQKKSLLDSLNDEYNECKAKFNGLEFKWETFKEEKNLKSQQLTLKSNELIKLKEEQAGQRNFMTQAHQLNLQQLRAKHDAELNKMASDYRAKIETLKYEKIKKFHEERDNLLDKVEEVRNTILTNGDTFKDMLKECDANHCVSKEKWLAEFQKRWKEDIRISEARALKVDSLSSLLKETLEPELRTKKRKLEGLKTQLNTLQLNFKSEQAETDHLRQTLASTEEEIDRLKKRKLELEEYIGNTEMELQQIHEILIKEETMRRTLHNELQELRGNIRVFCRVRPPLPHENSKAKNICVHQFDDGEGTQMIEILKERSGISKHLFKFDRIFDENETNNDVFGEICQLVQSSLDGYNVCIFAYGQTGSGKTYTMLNPKNGIIPATISHIFSWIDNLKERGWHYEVNCQFVEIYNEVIADLLRTASSNSNDHSNEEAYRNIKHEIRHDQETKTTIITNVTTCPIKSTDSVDALLRKANKLRSTASTAANDRSSRSHSIFVIHLNGVNKITGEESKGILNLVDLAGSERINMSQVVGERLRETQNINRSLSCLGDVINALGSPDAAKRHIPFRNSKLTYLLQYSLMGNSKTLMFVNISACFDNINENLNSLRFASKVNSTKMVTRKVDEGHKVYK